MSVSNLENDKKKASKHWLAGVSQSTIANKKPKFEITHDDVQNDRPEELSVLSRFGGLHSPDVGNGPGGPVGT